MLLQKSYYKNNLNLALPIILSSLGQSLVQMIDTIMVGRLGAKELAAVAFSGAIVSNIFVFGMGIAIALTPLAGQSYARGEYKKAASLFQNSLSLNIILAVVLSALLLLFTPFLSYLGQPNEIIDISKPYYMIVTLSLIPMLIFLAFKQFMEGVGNTKVSMIITISANLINIILNYILIYGKFGAPAMGITGAAIATLISRILAPISFLIYNSYHKHHKKYFKFFSWKNLLASEHIKILRIGLPIAGQMSLEFFSLLSITIMMGWVSTIALASYQIVITVVSTTYMIASGAANATTILVSHEFGRKNKLEAIKCSKAGFHLAVLTMCISATSLVLGGELVAKIFTSDINVIKLATQLFLVAAVFQVIDGAQVSLLGALRGINDVAKPMKYAFISYIMIAVPFGYICGFILNLGSWSIFAGFSAGLLSSVVLYYRRLKYSFKKMS